MARIFFEDSLCSWRVYLDLFLLQIKITCNICNALCQCSFTIKKTIAFEHLQDEYGKLYYCQIPNRGIELHHKPRLDIF